LRSDKRGAGESGGDFFATSISDNDADASAAVDWLAVRASGHPIYAIGHGEGARHVAHLAAEETVAGAVLIACPARCGEEILTWQAAQIVPTLRRRRERSSSSFTSTGQESAEGDCANPVDIRVRPPHSGQEAQRALVSRVHPLRPGAGPEAGPCGGPRVVAGHDMQIPPEDGDAICRLALGPCEAVIVSNPSHVLSDDPASKGPRRYRKAVKAAVNSGVPHAVADWVEQRVRQRSQLGESGHG
jgi:hypothetical protein